METERAGRRLILDPGHGAPDAGTMRAALEFARLLGLGLHCLFIEDEALLALADLPFAREIRLPAHEWSALDANTIAWELRQTASRMRRLLDEVLQGTGIPGEFQVLRGDPAACIAEVCQIGDVVAVVEPGSPVASATHGIRRLHAVAHELAASLLLLPPRHKAQQGKVVAIAETATDASLEFACRIAIAADENLLVLMPKLADDAAAERVRERAQALGLPRARIALRPVRSTHADDVVFALASLHERLIVMMHKGAAAGNSSGARRLSAARGVPVLLIESAPRVDQSARGPSRSNRPSGQAN